MAEIDLPPRKRDLWVLIVGLLFLSMVAWVAGRKMESLDPARGNPAATASATAPDAPQPPRAGSSEPPAAPPARAKPAAQVAAPKDAFPPSAPGTAPETPGYGGPTLLNSIMYFPVGKHSVRVLGRLNGDVSALAFDPAGNRVAAGSRGFPSKQLIIPSDPATCINAAVWDVRTGGRVLALWEDWGGVSGIALTDELLAVTTDLGVGQIRRLPSGELVSSFRHVDPLTAVALRPDRLVAGTRNGELLVVDPATGAIVDSFRAGRDAIRALQFGPEGREVIAAGADGAISVWDLQARKASAGTSFEPESRKEFAVALSAGGADAAAVRFAQDRTISGSSWVLQVGPSRGGSAPRSVPGRGHSLLSIALAPGAERAAASGWASDANISIWDVASGSLTHVLPGHQHATSAIRFSPRRELLGSGGQTGGVALWTLGEP